MKTVVTFQVFLLVFLSTFYQEEVSGQAFYSQYGGAPIVYADNSEDDDVGLLLTVLLLAAKKRNGNCNRCNCCNCGNTAKTVPIPFPIPFPTNNPIINKARSVYPNDDYEDGNGDRDDRDDRDDIDDKDDFKFSKNVTLKFVPEESNDYTNKGS